MKTPKIQINPILKKQIIKIFIQTLVDLKDEREATQFIQDFLTEDETEALAKRLACAYWLKKKRAYYNIRDNIKVSTSTIAFASSILKKPGVKRAIEKVEAEEWANQWAEKIKKIVK